jgi:hypothetical protein
MQYVGKLIMFVVTAVLGSTLAASLIAGDFTSNTLWGLLILVGGSVVMFLKANTVTQPYAKKIVGVLTVVLLAVVDAATDHHISSAEVAQILLAFVGAFSVDAVNNVGDHYDVHVKGNASAGRTLG